MHITKTIISILSINILFSFSAQAIDSGEYTKTHEIGKFSNKGEMEFEEVINTLSINKLNNEIFFEINITAPNYHSCRIKGTAKKEKDHYVYKEEIKYHPQGQKIGDCILEFHQEDNEVYLLDKKLVCRKKYCGARGGFSGERFEKQK